MTEQQLTTQVQNKTSVQFREPLAGGHWLIGVASGAMGVYSSIPGSLGHIDYKETPDPHPWLTNLRDHARMLNGELELPHEIKLSGNARQRRRMRS